MASVRRVAIAFAIVAGLAVLVPITLFVTYDLSCFQSRRDEIRSLGMQTPLPATSTATLSALMRADYEETGYSHITARILIDKLPIEWNGNGRMGWQTTFAIWTLLVHLHLDEREQFAIIAGNSYMGLERYGFAAEATARFGKPLALLNEEELATLVVLLHAPSMYQENPELLLKRRDRLVGKIQEYRAPIAQ